MAISIRRDLYTEVTSRISPNSNVAQRLGSSLGLQHRDRTSRRTR